MSQTCHHWQYITAATTTTICQKLRVRCWLEPGEVELRTSPMKKPSNASSDLEAEAIGVVASTTT